MISYSEPLGHVHNDYQFEIMFWKCRSAIGYTQQKSMEKAKRAFEDILKVLPDDFYEYLNHEIFMHAGIFYHKHRNMDKAQESFEMSWNHSTKYYHGHALKSDKRVINERKDFQAEFCHNKGCVIATADQYEKAEGLFLRSLDIKLELLGKNSVNADIRLRYHALGNVYCGLHRGSKSQ